MSNPEVLKRLKEIEQTCGLFTLEKPDQLSWLISQLRKELEDHEKTKKALTAKIENIQFLSKMFERERKELQAKLATELAVNALLSEALEKIREENKRYADTAVMDWDGVQEFASQALEAVAKLRSGK